MSTPSSRGEARPSFPSAQFLSRVISFLLVGLIAVYTWQPLQGGEDFWSHAAVGRWIVENGRVPFETLWLWSTPPQPWVAHSWLSQVVLFGLMQWGGAHLVLLFTAVLVALPFTWSWILWRRRGGSAAFGALLISLAITCAAARFQPRPELFSYFFLAVLMLILVARTDPANASLPQISLRLQTAGLIVLFAMWANCHGGVALGLAILFLTAVCEVLQRRRVKSLLWLLGTFVLCAAAVNLNPYGLRFWSTLRQVGGEMFQLIDEWKSPLTDPALPPIAIALVVLVAAIAGLAWAANPERRWSQLAWLLFFTALFFSARRNLWPLMMVSVLVAAANSNSLRAAILMPSVQITASMRRLTHSALITVLLIWMFTAVSPEAIVTNDGRPSLRAVSRYAPVGVAEYVLQENPPDAIFNDYLRSSYFQWAFEGKRRLYIDVQNAYPPQLLKDYFSLVAHDERGAELMHRLPIYTVISGRWSGNGRFAPLAKFLDASPNWQREYSGEDGAVWVRRRAN